MDKGKQESPKSKIDMNMKSYSIHIFKDGRGPEFKCNEIPIVASNEQYLVLYEDPKFRIIDIHEDEYSLNAYTLDKPIVVEIDFEHFTTSNGIIINLYSFKDEIEALTLMENALVDYLKNDGWKNKISTKDLFENIKITLS